MVSSTTISNNSDFELPSVQGNKIIHKFMTSSHNLSNNSEIRFSVQRKLNITGSISSEQDTVV